MTAGGHSFYPWPDVDAFWPWPSVDQHVPWEGMPAIMELRAFLDQHGHRPTPRRTYAFWAVTVVASDLDVATRAAVAYDLDPDVQVLMQPVAGGPAVSQEAARRTGGRFVFDWDSLRAFGDRSEAIQMWLAYAPWRSPDHAARYEAAVTRAQDPLARFRPRQLAYPRRVEEG